MTNNLFIRKYLALTRVCLVKHLLPAPLEDQKMEKPMHFLTVDLKKKLITSERTSRRNLCRVVVYKVLQSKVEIDFFLKIIMVTIGKEFCTTQNFLQRV